MAWTQYQQSTLKYLALVELGDWPNTSYRFVSDNEIGEYIDEWHDILQQELEFLWGTASLAVGAGTSTITETALATDIMRVDRCYWNPASSTATYLLSHRDPEDLFLSQQNYTTTGTGEQPKVIYALGTGSWCLWPTPPTAGTLHVEYVVRYRFPNQSTDVPFPSWSRYWSTPYVAYRVYSRFGPLQDLPRAAVYRRQVDHNLEIGRKLRDLYLPASQAGVLRPGRSLANRILYPQGGNL